MEDQVFSIDSQGRHAPVCVFPSTMSNHHSINACIHLDSSVDNRKKKNTSFKLNTFLLNNEDSDGEM